MAGRPTCKIVNVRNSKANSTKKFQKIYQDGMDASKLSHMSNQDSDTKY